MYIHNNDLMIHLRLNTSEFENLYNFSCRFWERHLLTPNILQPLRNSILLHPPMEHGQGILNFYGGTGDFNAT